MVLKQTDNLMDKVVSLCKRRGFIYPSSEIYGGFAAIYDYGPYGVLLENNIKRAWWKHYVQLRDDIVGLDSSIFMNPKIWHASGHVKGFSDPLVECRNCHARSRADKLLEEIGIQADEKIGIDEINQIFSKYSDKIKCPECGKSNFTKIKKFNLLVKSNLGSYTEDLDVEPSYLRGETCQGIYVNFKSVLDSMRVRIPFGIAQIGKAFRNEITARKFVFRTREFEQMEMQYFTHPKDEMNLYEKLREDRWSFFNSLGFKDGNLRWKKHDNLVFYAKEAYDLEFNFPWGFDELEGVHARGDYDLTQHSKYSGVDLSYVDPETNEKYMPHIIESSVGVGRLIFALMLDAYTEEGEGKDQRIVLKIDRNLAPIKIAIFPLLSNKPDLVSKSKSIYDSLKLKFFCEFDGSGNIGKRYRRQDEIGTPYCITVDFDTLTDNMVTVRDRDSMTQERIKVEDLQSFFSEKFE
jgi:glycyl-tRNA synthetase